MNNKKDISELLKNAYKIAHRQTINGAGNHIIINEKTFNELNKVISISQRNVKINKILKNNQK